MRLPGASPSGARGCAASAAPPRGATCRARPAPGRTPDPATTPARSSGRLTGIAVTLAHHPDPADPDPWIGLLMVDAKLHGQGHGSRLAALLEDRFRAAGRTAARLALLANNHKAMAFWTALGYEVLDHRENRGMGHPCTVLRKEPATP
ncbi:GNAT family N-acetyltransferase [Streptomyces qaidamensis]|uniref:GNAT family N-acetyltransferase n=1 Tax=Streptomyces qaidamensis TaxID=1783515 RepID=UPI0009A04709